LFVTVQSRFFADFVRIIALPSLSKKTTAQDKARVKIEN